MIDESEELHQRIENPEAEETKRKKTESVSKVSLVDHKRIIFI